MTLAIEVGVYTTASVMLLGAAVMIYFANKRFLEGEFKRLMNWFVAAALTFFFGAFFSIIYAVISPSIYASTMLIVGGFSMILSAIFFIRVAFLLHDFSKVFGFADIEKSFDYLLEGGKKAEAATPKPKIRKRHKK